MRIIFISTVLISLFLMATASFAKSKVKLSKDLLTNSLYLLLVPDYTIEKTESEGNRLSLNLTVTVPTRFYGKETGLHPTMIFLPSFRIQASEDHKRYIAGVKYYFLLYRQWKKIAPVAETSFYWQEQNLGRMIGAGALINTIFRVMIERYQNDQEISYAATFGMSFVSFPLFIKL